MKDVRSTVMQLSGRWGNTCYNMLCLAVEAARGLPREEFQMKRIWSAVREATGKSPETISRALTRAATDIWERGNRELLMAIFARTLTKAPTKSADSQGTCVYAGGICEAVTGLPVLLGAALGAVRAACASGPRAGCHDRAVFCEPCRCGKARRAADRPAEAACRVPAPVPQRRDPRRPSRAKRRMDKTGRRSIDDVPYGVTEIFRENS